MVVRPTPVSRVAERRTALRYPLRLPVVFSWQDESGRVHGCDVGGNRRALLVDRLRRQIALRFERFVAFEIGLCAGQIHARLTERRLCRANGGRVLPVGRVRLVSGLRVARDVFGDRSLRRSELRFEIVGEKPGEHLTRMYVVAFLNVDLVASVGQQV